VSGQDSSPLPQRDGSVTLGALIDAYVERYAGRDQSRIYRLRWWCDRLGGATLQDLSDDQVHAALEGLRMQRSRYFAGTDADGEPIFRAKGGKVSGATVNRYLASLSAVITWAVRQRIAPRGFLNPCKGVERAEEAQGRTRYLDEAERERLLRACRNSPWSLLWLLVAMAITTGARKSELLGLRWDDINLERAEATLSTSKNGEPRVLPLMPAVVDELRATRGRIRGTARVFASRRNADLPFAFEPHFKAALSQAGIRNFRFHDCRHTTASALAQAGASLLEVATVLGHRQLKMAARYSHLGTQHKRALVHRVLGDLR
jgi:integrase